MGVAAMRLVVAALAAAWPWGIAAAGQSVAGAPEQSRGGSGHLRARRLHGEGEAHAHDGFTHQDFHLTNAGPPAPEAEQPHGQWFPGPTVGNREWREANCSAHFYPTFAAATHACFELHGGACTGFHDIGCDGRGWRFCTGDMMDMALEAGPAGVACTMVPYDLVRPTTHSPPPPSPDRYEPGPNVSDKAWRAGGCTPFYCSTMDEAIASCLASSPPCTAIHDMKCDGRGFRACYGSLEAMIAHDNSTDACTLVHAGLETFTSTTHTTTSMAYTLEAQKVPNQAWAACHPHADNTTGRHILVPTLEEAQEACLASPSCNGLIDLNCDGFGYRLCEEVDDIFHFELDLTYARRDVKYACVWRKHTTTVTTTTTTTSTALADIFSEGPRMGNMAWRAGACSQPYVVTNASSQEEQAMRECERMGADCEGLHDIGCDGIGYRLCEIMNTTAMVEFENSTEACSIVKELDPCSCQYVWEFNGSTHGGCSETPDYNHTWCYVTGGERCANASASTAGADLAWRDCDAPCACLPEWEWLGVEYEGCSETFDWPGHSWCFINDGRRCPGAVQSTVHPERYWSEACKGPCECRPRWDYLNHSYSNCSETPDWWGNTWCYVEGGADCPSAQPSTTSAGMHWDDTCEGPCDCLESWDWRGASYGGCAMTPDWENHDWCYVRDGARCGSAVQSTVDPGRWWSQTCSACIKPGHDVGGSYNECGYMPIFKILTTDPSYTTPGWCYACEAVQLVDVRAIGTSVACQARCAEEEDCDYFYHTVEPEGVYCFLKRYYDAELVLNVTNDASCDPLYQPAEGTAGPKKCDEGIFKSYADGPHVSNRAATHCSDWYGSLGDAEYICNMHDDCTGLIDFACDGGDGWRWCTEPPEVLASAGEDTMACTKVASASGAP